MKNMRFFVVLVMFLSSISFLGAQVNVTLKADATFTNPNGIKERIEKTASAILTEINMAQQGKRELQLVNMNMNKFASSGLAMLWATTHFYCDDEEVVERVWPMANGNYVIRHIPLIITPNGQDLYGTGTYQEAVLEFDSEGRMTDFRLAFDAHLSESLEHCGTLEVERSAIILEYLERFRTAYNTKDIQFLEQIFSDDALIITGKVVTSVEGTIKVSYTESDKVKYLRNLRRVFARNAWINVKFSPIGAHGETGGCPGITRSQSNPNFYGVRVRQEWTSSTYSDTGYVFLLWDFTNQEKPQIHVRTWQPEWVGGTKLPEEDIFDTINFEEDIQKLSN